MKYLSVLIFIGTMYWTWGLARNQGPLTQQVHVGIQEELKHLIADYIQQNVPNSKNLQFDRFYTETLTDNKVKASFTYSFEDQNESVGETRVQIEGFAVLNRSNETPDNIEWSFDELVILNNQVDYKDPIKVTPPPPAEHTGG